MTASTTFLASDPSTPPVQSGAAEGRGRTWDPLAWYCTGRLARNLPRPRRRARGEVGRARGGAGVAEHPAPAQGRPRGEPTLGVPEDEYLELGSFSRDNPSCP
ncbi:hypothetical protein WME76_00835 [Sorangium sp. So ce119]|uniref:hypothetical protein n=1 Tax=Sorangium sp. So ce119 TaxID=3133279 RepID=UPI003F609FBF